MLFLRVLLTVVINFIAILIGLYLTFYAEEITKSYVNFEISVFSFSMGAGFIVGIIAFLLSFNREFQKYTIGLSVICFSILTASFVSINKLVSFEGYYRIFKVERLSPSATNNIISVKIDREFKNTEVGYEYSIKTDSVEIRIDRGLFGIEFLSDNVKVPVNNNCDQILIPEEITSDLLLKAAKHFTYLRCFANAKHCFDTYTDNGEVTYEGIYYSALLDLTLNEFDSAIIKFKQALKLYESSNKNELNDIVSYQDDDLVYIDNLDSNFYSDGAVEHIELFYHGGGFIENINKKIHFCHIMKSR